MDHFMHIEVKYLTWMHLIDPMWVYQMLRVTLK